MSWVLRAVVVPVVALVAMIVLIRPNNVAFGTVWLGVAAFVLFVDVATLFRGWVQNFCVVLATLTVGLTITEAYALLRQPKIAETETGLWGRDANLGYSPEKPNTVVPVEKKVDGRLSFRASYTIDAAGRRMTRSRPGGPKICFFGDSYTFGEGLNDNETLPQLFADMSGADVLNYGYPGYSPAQALRALQLGLYDRDLAGAKLFVLQTAPFHIERTSCMPLWAAGFPRYVTIDGRLELDGKCRSHRWQDFGVYQLLLQQFFERVRRPDVDNYINVVDAFIKLAKQKYHVDVVVFDMNSEADELIGTGYTSKDVEAKFREAGAITVDDAIKPARGERMSIPYDGHPTGAKNRLLARRLFDGLVGERPDLFRPPEPAKSTP